MEKNDILKYCKYKFLYLQLVNLVQNTHNLQTHFQIFVFSVMVFKGFVEKIIKIFLSNPPLCCHIDWKQDNAKFYAIL